MTKSNNILPPPITASPLLNRKIVDVDIEQETPNAPTQQTPTQTPTQIHPQKETGDQESHPPDPQKTPPGQPSTEPEQESFSRPQSPPTDESVPEMEFAFSDEGERGDEKEGGSENKVTDEQAGSFAGILAQLTGFGLPKLFSGFAKIKVSELEPLVAEGLITPDHVEVIRKINDQTEKAIELSDEEMKMLKEALEAWIKFQQISVANPTNALILTLATIMLNMGIKTSQLAKANNAWYKQYLKKTGIERVLVNYENIGPVIQKPNRTKQDDLDDNIVDKKQNGTTGDDKE